jgi:ABC-2 type transport system ATP-binding protein
MAIAIKTNDLSRTFSDAGEKKGGLFWALRDVNIEIPDGMIFGLLGPNGAGKTTLIKILSTLLLPSAGEALVAGYNVDNEYDKIRPVINMVSGGENCGYGILTVAENLWMFTQFYGIPTKPAMKRIKELLEIMNLTEKADTKINKLSTGMRQKMNFIRGFVTDPKILFLDEPTLGLDVNAARETRKFVMNWVKTAEEPKTVILTTHYMQEADEMCDRLAIIDHGKILAEDTPRNLKKQESGGISYNITVGYKDFDAEGLRKIPGVGSFAHSVLDEQGMIEMVFILQTDAALARIIEKINLEGFSINNIQKTEFTLEDAFIKLVGRRLSNGESDAR